VAQPGRRPRAATANKEEVRHKEGSTATEELGGCAPQRGLHQAAADEQAEGRGVAQRGSTKPPPDAAMSPPGMHRRRTRRRTAAAEYAERVSVVDEHTEAHGPLLFPATLVVLARVFLLLHRF
jgi:hypothetical protein